VKDTEFTRGLQKFSADLDQNLQVQHEERKRQEEAERRRAAEKAQADEQVRKKQEEERKEKEQQEKKTQEAAAAYKSRGCHPERRKVFEARKAQFETVWNEYQRMAKGDALKNDVHLKQILEKLDEIVKPFTPGSAQQCADTALLAYRFLQQTHQGNQQLLSICMCFLIDDMLKRCISSVDSLTQMLGIGVYAMMLSCLLPQFGTLVMYVLNSECPYTIPWFHHRDECDSDTAFRRLLGYKVTVLVVDEKKAKLLGVPAGRTEKEESTEAYRKRMKGDVMLFAAFTQASAIDGILYTSTSNGERPFANGTSNLDVTQCGISECYLWLAAMLNASHSEEVIQSIHYVLEIAGYPLSRAFPRQFAKMCSLIMQRIAAMQEPATSVTYLKTSIQKYFNDRVFPRSEKLDTFLKPSS
jgi:hypothetical protein